MTDIALRKELVALGYNDRSLGRAVSTGALAKPRRGAYVDGPTWRSLSREERYSVCVRAVLRQAGTDVAASHTSALPFLGAPTWGLALDDVHILRKDGKAGRHEAGVRQHRGVIGPDDLVAVGDFEVSAPMRATLEVLTLGTVEAGLVVLSYFLHRGDFTEESPREWWALRAGGEA